MIYKHIATTENGNKVYARIDDDGLCRLTCSEEHPELKAWLDEGNEPEPADEVA